MPGKEINSGSSPSKRAYVTSGFGRLVVIPIIVGLLTAASILLLIYQENRSVQSGFEAAEVWTAYQVKIVRTTVEEDPNLKEQYTEEREALHQQALELREKNSRARQAVMISTYAALLLLIGAATAAVALVRNSIRVSYAGLLMDVIGVGLAIKALF